MRFLFSVFVLLLVVPLDSAQDIGFHLNSYNTWVSLNYILPFQNGISYTFSYILSSSGASASLKVIASTANCTNLASYTSGVNIALLKASSQENYVISSSQIQIYNQLSGASQTTFGSTAPNGYGYEDKVAWTIQGIPASCFTGTTLIITSQVNPFYSPHRLYYWNGAVTASSKRSSSFMIPRKRHWDIPWDEMTVGCYIDHPDQPDLAVMIEDSSSMTVERCSVDCDPNYYRYYALQKGTQCWCGNTYGNYGPVDDSYCNTPCGSYSQSTSPNNCGGNSFNYVYGTIGTNAGPLFSYQISGAFAMFEEYDGSQPATAHAMA